jgi:hypothetical protein
MSNAKLQDERIYAVISTAVGAGIPRNGDAPIFDGAEGAREREHAADGAGKESTVAGDSKTTMSAGHQTGEGASARVEELGSGWSDAERTVLMHALEDAEGGSAGEDGAGRGKEIRAREAAHEAWLRSVAEHAIWELREQVCTAATFHAEVEVSADQSAPRSMPTVTLIPCTCERRATSAWLPAPQMSMLQTFVCLQLSVERSQKEVTAMLRIMRLYRDVKVSACCRNTHKQ